MLVFTNISQLITLAPLVEANHSLAKISQKDLGIYEDAWLAVKDSKIIDYGSGRVDSKYAEWERIDTGNGLVLPGLVDAHTHPIFGGDRSAEFADRLNGKTYGDIAKEGGGIQTTIKATRSSSNQELKDTCEQRLSQLSTWGTTTIECKTGYGQSPDEELRQLQILRQIERENKLDLKLTYLGLHAFPKHDGIDKPQFISDMTNLIPEIAKQKLADYCDAFVENGYFSTDECRSYFESARDHNLGIRIHADEFADSGAAAFAADMKANSADHLEECSTVGAQKMSEAGTIATLLPGTSLYSKIAFAKAQLFQSHDCPIALATDFNPGSCRIPNLPLVASLGGLYCGLNTASAISAVTLVPAKSLGLNNHIGALARGYQADFLVHDAGKLSHWMADFGQKKPRWVYKKGLRIH
ncbi:MAG: imidazolonepropionase [Pseudobacteriovorax sp.]|nr:imidazolonepropionase [Pseudobacteriovorax sp.]